VIDNSKFGRWIDWLKRDATRRLLAVFLLAVGAAVLLVDFVSTPNWDVQVGEVADRDIRASHAFQYVDKQRTEDRQREAEERVALVFDYDTNVAIRLQEQTRRAFTLTRDRYAALETQTLESDEVDAVDMAEIRAFFESELSVSLDAEDLDRIAVAKWSNDIENRATELIGLGMRTYITADVSLSSMGTGPLTVIRIYEDSREEIELTSRGQVFTVAQMRPQITLLALERGMSEDPDVEHAARAIARALMRPNFSYNQLLTADRRRDARQATDDVILQVNEGSIIVNTGDVITEQHHQMLQILSESRTKQGVFGFLLALTVFIALVVVTFYAFGAGFVRKFSTRPRDIEAGVFLALLVVLIGRIFMELSGPLSQVVGLAMGPSSLWYAVPFAGGAMLVRILINSETALVWVVSTALLLGLLMEQNLLVMVFFTVSGLTAAGGIAHTKERVNIVGAGLQTGLVNAAAVLLIQLVQLHMGAATMGASMSHPLWDMGFALLGGVLSAFLVLGLAPVFEVFGFVTDFKLLELANLNHPLLRQLMLRAPGTYHHSHTVAALSESAAEAIGAHALRTRVACYFHDIGKALEPQYFIENQGGGPNPHDRLKPHQSARVIINHVIDGAAIAEQHKLPVEVVDAIMTHHGTSRVAYFYAKALEEAGPDEHVDEAAFRYPGRRPATRESGIIFLADRVEAACRTLNTPSEDEFRGMIQKLVNDAVTDGQLVECPLTLAELYTIVDSFTNTLLGIHHHRIEYPLLPSEKSNEDPNHDAPGPFITLEMANPLTTQSDEASEDRGDSTG